MDQLSDEWFQARLGKVTASRIGDVMARTKSGYGAARANYAAQLKLERLTGLRAASFTSAAMMHGTDTEPQARAAYSFETGLDVVEEAFAVHPAIPDAGASPDGLVGDDGLVEIKCPNSSTHFETLEGAPIADRYIKQMQWQIACTGRKWCDFASFDPRFPVAMQLHVRRVERDDELIADIEAEVTAFLAEVEASVAALNEQYNQKESA